MSLASFLGLNTRDTGECIVRIGGSEFSEYYQNLQTTEITLQRRDSSQAILTFAMLRDADGSWPLAEDERVQTWAQVEVQVVFGDAEEPFFSGYIREISTNIPESGSVATVTLDCQDIFAAMDRNCRRVTWDEGRESLDIIREIIAPYGLTLDTDLTSTPVDSRHQNKTDYRFIRELAEENSYEWYLRDRQAGVRELYYGPPRASAEASGNKLMIHAGRETNCLTFNVSYDGYQPDRIRFSTAPLDRRRDRAGQPDTRTAAVRQPQRRLLGPGVWTTSNGVCPLGTATIRRARRPAPRVRRRSVPSSSRPAAGWTAPPMAACCCRAAWSKWAGPGRTTASGMWTVPCTPLTVAVITSISS